MLPVKKATQKFFIVNGKPSLPYIKKKPKILQRINGIITL